MYLHVPKEKRTNLDPSRKKGIFLAYSDESKAYQIYFTRFKKIETRKDVTFNEVQLTTSQNNSTLKMLKNLKFPEPKMSLWKK